MGQVVSETVWIGNPSRMVEKGTRREDVPEELVGYIGDHVWGEEGETPLVGADGEALTGLRSAVHIDGKLYEAGTVPPDDVLAKVGSHMWVPGFTPPPAETSARPAEDEQTGEESEAPAEDEPEAEPSDDSEEGDEESPESPVTGEAEQVPADEGTEAPAADAPEPPPHAGKGSSEQAWRDYAAAVGVDIEGIEDRKGIRAALEAAGKPV